LRVHAYIRVMKTKTALSLMVWWLMNGVGLAQPAGLPPTSLPGGPAEPTPAGVAVQANPLPRRGPGGRGGGAANDDDLRKFNLDFGGGTPQQLVEAIQKATGEPLNVIIPEQDKEVALPALKMRQVTVDDLFVAMEQSSRRMEIQVTGTYFSSPVNAHSQYTQIETSYGFRKVGSVWIFSNKKANPPPDQVLVRTRFYQLDPYLGQHTVEDITTAIKTAWTMMTKNNLAANRPGVGTELKFHKETGLLIAVGDTQQVQVIDDVLAALGPGLAPKPKPGNVPTKTNEPAKP